MPSRYRKPPVEVEAVQWDGSLKQAREIEKWSDFAVTIRVGDFSNYLGFDDANGQPCSASEGHWIILGHRVEGEYAALDAESFEATYEPDGERVTYGDPAETMAELEDARAALFKADQDVVAAEARLAEVEQERDDAKVGNALAIEQSSRDLERAERAEVTLSLRPVSAGWYLTQDRRFQITSSMDGDGTWAIAQNSLVEDDVFAETTDAIAEAWGSEEKQPRFGSLGEARAWLVAQMYAPGRPFDLQKDDGVDDAREGG